ncbi:putative transcription factor FAR family [Helianthus debilis subsp. tardiflorus]
MPMNDAIVYKERGVRRVSPGTGKIFYTPDVSESLKPRVGMVFDSIDQAYGFYVKYAHASGFSVRKNTSYNNSKGVLKLKYFTCSKEGFKIPNKGKGKRRKPSKRVGCEAHIKLQLTNDGKFEVYIFQEEYNHSFVHEKDLQFLTSVRRVDHVKENAIQALSTINLGPVRAFNVLKSLYGSYEEVGATRTDFKNYKRDLNQYIGENDADMVIKRLAKKKEYCPNFSFEYEVNQDGTLGGVFWADEISKITYMVFGDVVGFDATYMSNKYDMVFVPFTGIDNHNRNVTLGAALLGSETADSYRWLLRMYVKAFGVAPKVVVTDQDPTMKRAILDVLPDSRHRLCMWHIWEKLTPKLGPVLCNPTDFKKTLAKIVWSDSISRNEFEEKWHAILSEYGLSNHEWLGSLYNIRHDWIPAYYLEENLSGLMRTTSRSESENHFFNQFCNPQSTLVEFFSHFETAMEAQMYEHRKNDHETRYNEDELWFPYFVLEEQALKLFTRTIFLDQQLEIYDAINKCASISRQQVDGCMKFEIEDLLQPRTSYFEVMFRNEDQTISCSCRRFEQWGLLCRHIFYVLRLCYVTEFPKKYVAKRWRREAVPNSSLRPIRYDDIENNGDDIQEILREIRFANEYAINRLIQDKEQLCLYRDYRKAYMSKADDVQVVAPAPSRKDRFAEMTGISEPCDFIVRNPIKTRTKGTHKRLKSAREIAITQAGKKQKGCSFCKGTGHNVRICSLRIQSTKEKEATSSSGVTNMQE